MARGINKADAHKTNELYASGMSISEVSAETGVALSTIRFRLKSAGLLRSRADGVKIAAKKGRLGSGNRGKKRVFTEQWRKNISIARKGNGVGVSKKPNGYMEITMGENKGMGQHRVVMEAHLGRPLLTDEVVHHIDKDRSNNALENLELMSRSEHARHHAVEANETRKRDALGRYL